MFDRIKCSDIFPISTASISTLEENYSERARKSSYEIFRKFIDDKISNFIMTEILEFPLQNAV